MASDHVARGDTDAGLQFEAVQAALDFAGGLEGVRGGVVKRNWRSEHRKRRIALELINHALVAVHHLNDNLEELVERLHDLLGGVLDGVGGGADDVDKQHRDPAFLAAELRALLKRLLCDLSTDVLGKHVANTLAVLQTPHHLVKAGLEDADLGAVVNVHLRIALTAAHTVDGDLQLLNRINDDHRRKRRPHKPRENTRRDQRHDRRRHLTRGVPEVADALRNSQQQHPDHRHGGGGEPRQHQPRRNRRLERRILEPPRQRRRRNRTHETLRLQIREHRHHKTRQDGGGEDDDAQGDVDKQRAHRDNRNAQPPHRNNDDRLQHRQTHHQMPHHVRVMIIRAPLPLQHRPEQEKRDDHTERNSNRRIQHPDKPKLAVET